MRYFPSVYLALFILLFVACTPSSNIKGRYTNVFAEVAGQEFRFYNKPNKFEYYSKTEGAIKAYSFGVWLQVRGKIIVNGFNDENLNVLDVESNVENYQDKNGNMIVVQYKPNFLDTFTKVDIIINESIKVRIMGDTTFFIDSEVNSLQIKTYLVYEGLLLAMPPLIDTLYSPEIKVANLNKQKRIILKFNVGWSDFYRVKLNDTLNVMNNRTLLWRKREFKKIRK